MWINKFLLGTTFPILIAIALLIPVAGVVGLVLLIDYNMYLAIPVVMILCGVLNIFTDKV